MQAASRFVINNRSGAMRQPGYISSETLRSTEDKDTVLVVSMWDNLEAREAWKNSDIRKANVAEFRDYLIGGAEYEYYSLGLSLG